ncbi:MAG: hypothetical protein A2086_04910 [Spirochaetes bacterium GWD1_27_9]|nr:MAG: hypothetical protein A2Z98_06955 [Spirochaetes bacterium GWB1_27_13]OHD21486.1 MAG: hypothetical protein A2Y34_01385 [Spirochaetes bacterium GWC1_27_15]OHD42448.1 MAG: hypothetical protein A2086_04910 [Spirochaetes bacterium GWD1_27_9]
MTDRQIEIINATLEIISENGIQELTVKKIADKIGITDAAIFKHFKSKNDIFAGIIEVFKEDSTKMLEEIISTSHTSFEKIKTFFLNRCQTFLKNRDLTSILFSNDIFINNKAVLAKIDQIIENHRKLIAKSIVEGQSNGEIRKDVIPEHVFIIIMGSLRLLVTKWKSSNYSFDIYQEGESLWETLQTILKPI